MDQTSQTKSTSLCLSSQMTGPSYVLMSDSVGIRSIVYALTGKELFDTSEYLHRAALSARFSPSLYSQMRGSSYADVSLIHHSLLSDSAQILDLEYLSVLMTNVSNFVSLKLSGSRNYLVWKAQMVCLLESKNMYGIVDSSFSGPKHSGSGISRQYDSLVRSWIFGSVTEDVLVYVFNLDSAKDVWEKLKSIYDPTVCLQEVKHIKKMEWTILPLRFPDDLWDEIDKLEDSDTNHPCNTMPKLYCPRLVKVEQSMKNTAESFSITAALMTAIMFAAGIIVPDASNKELEMLTIKVKTPLFIFVISNAISLFASNTALLVFLSILAPGFAEKDFLLGLPRRLFIGLCFFFLCIAAMMVALSASLFLVFCNQKPWKLVLICGLLFSAIAFSLTLQFPLMVDLFKSTYLRIFGKQRKTHVVRDFKLLKNICEGFIEGDWSEEESMVKKVRQLATQGISRNGCTVLQLAAETGTKENDVGFCNAYIDDNGDNTDDIIGYTYRDLKECLKVIHKEEEDNKGEKTICDTTALQNESETKNEDTQNSEKKIECCCEGPQRVLVYNENIKTRFQIMLRIARAIQYLHEGSHIGIIHRDIKPINILLDGNFQPKISDFGLSRLFPEDQAYLRTTFTRTFGYTAPKYAIGWELFEKADIYNFGAAVLVVSALLTHKGTIKKEVINKYGEIPLDTAEKFNRSGIAITLQQHGVKKAKSIKNTRPPSTQATRNSTTVIAVIIATVTFTTIFQLPSQHVDKSNQILNGFSSDEGSIASNPGFIVFLIFAISALFISLAIVVLQTSIVMVGKRAKKQVMAVTNKLIWLALVFVSAAFLALSFVVVDGRNKKWLAVGVKVADSVTLASTKDDVLLDDNAFGL